MNCIDTLCRWKDASLYNIITLIFLSWLNSFLLTTFLTWHGKCYGQKFMILPTDFSLLLGLYVPLNKWSACIFLPHACIYFLFHCNTTSYKCVLYCFCSCTTQLQQNSHFNCIWLCEMSIRVFGLIVVFGFRNV